MPEQSKCARSLRTSPPIRLLAWLASLLPALALTVGQATAADWPTCGTADTVPQAEWAAAEAAGWDHAALARLADASGESEAAVVIAHRGRLVAAWGDVEKPRLVQSVRKALLNALVGQEIAAGRLALDATLVDLGIDDEDPPLQPRARTTTLRQLLLSRSGIHHSAHYEVGGWKRAREQLAERLIAETGQPDHPPGERWLYNNWDFNALGTIVERSAGKPIGTLFAERIAGPLGMQDFEPDDVEYTGNGSVSAKAMHNRSIHRAYAFLISARDLARFGTLYLNCGRWGDEQVIPKGWVLESTTGVDTLEGSTSDSWQQRFGYFGYLWWVDRGDRRRMKSLPDDLNSYFSSGAGGHRLLVVPALDLVVAHVIPTPGGVGDFAQIRRRIFGSPEVDDAEVEALLAGIVAAHPKGKGDSPRR